MNKNLPTRLTYSVLFNKYKHEIISIFVIIVCLFIFVGLIVPEISDIFSAKSEVEKISEKIKILKDNINYLSGLSDSSLDSQVILTNSALPIEKDFAGITNAINNASVKSGVIVQDYGFAVGDLNSNEIGKKRPSIDIIFTINSSSNGVRRFLSEIYKSLPLSEVGEVSISKTSATIKISFYFRPFLLSKIDPAAPIIKLSPADTELINKISSWKTDNSYQNLPDSITFP